MCGAVLAGSGMVATWFFTANNILGFGIYQNSTIERIDKIEELYVRRGSYNELKELLKTSIDDSKDLQNQLANESTKVAHLTDLLNIERQNGQARAIACQRLANSISFAKNQQDSLEQSIALRYRPSGIFQAPSKDVPLEDAQNSDRRYSQMLQQQILEFTREMHLACGYTPS